MKILTRSRKAKESRPRLGRQQPAAGQSHDGWKCGVCGQRHKGVPVSYGAHAPYLWNTIPDNERKRRCLLSSDQCVIDGQHFFVAGCIDIPIVDRESTFSWSVWVSLSQANFDRATDLWETLGRESEPPYFGWLSTALPAYPVPTLNLKTHVHTRPVGVRPYIELEPTDHPLAVEQREGIPWQRVQEIAEIVLHPEEAAPAGA